MTASAHRGPIRRALAGALLCQYALLFGVLPVVHAAVLDGGPPRVAHIETQGNPACPPAHDDLHCQACQTLRLASLPSTSVPPLETVAPAVRQAPVVAIVPSWATQASPLGSRAPPLL